MLISIFSSHLKKGICDKCSKGIINSCLVEPLYFYQMMRLLRRLKLIGESSEVQENSNKLRNRQAQQLSLLEPLSKQVDASLLNKTIVQLLQAPSEETFNTFASRCLKPEIRSLNALADVNIERVFENGAHKKVPFTVKDHLKVAGMIETCGFTDNLRPSETSSDVVQLLERENCVAFAHTNIPQGLLGIQSSNTLFGTVLNPHNQAFISGGSSGGEGALVASKACAFGVASDSGGSARMPAAFCGVYAYKPTGSKRLSVKGRVGPGGTEGFKFGDVDASFGFITRHFDDLGWLCSKTIGKTVSQDAPALYGGEWDTSKFQAGKRKKLKVGYMYESSEMRIAPGIENTILETLALLQKNNHSVVEFKFPKLNKFRDFFFEFVYQTGFLTPIHRRMEGHHTSHQIQSFYDIQSMGSPLVRWKIQKQTDNQMKHIYSLFLKDTNAMEMLRMHKEMDDLKKEFMREWRKLDLDILITPVTPFTALLPDSTEYLVFQLAYCCFQNVMELPAGVIPTRLVKAEETKYTASNIFEKEAEESIRHSEGMPLAIQVTGRHMMDEQCLGAMWQVAKLNGRYLQPKLGVK